MPYITGQDQITGYQVFGQFDDGFPEILIYDSNEPLGSGVYNIYVVPPTAIKHVIIKRNGLLTLCEVDVFGSESSLFHFLFARPPAFNYC